MVTILQNSQRAKEFLLKLATGQGGGAPPTGGAVSGPCVKAGFLAGKVYPNGIPVASIAAVQEFGAAIRHTTGQGTFVQTIPPRPFLRPAMQQGAPQWVEVFRKTLSTHQKGADPTQHLAAALHTTGAAMQASITRAIQAVETPPNAPATIRHKHTQKPLV